MISVFGATGFIGSRFCKMYPSAFPRDRDMLYPMGLNADILYLISTTHNYNNLPFDVETNLLELSKRLEKLEPGDTFNFVSSWFIYPPGIKLPAMDNMIIDLMPPGNYSMTKWLAERMVFRYCIRENISFRIFRLANVFGKGDKYSKEKNALQYLINEMRHDRDIDLYYGGDFIRDYIHVDDVCIAMYNGMKSLPVNDVYNIGSGIPMRFKDLIWSAHRVLGSKSRIGSMNPSEFHEKVGAKDFWMDITKAKEYGIFADSSPYEKLMRMILDES